MTISNKMRYIIVILFSLLLVLALEPHLASRFRFPLGQDEDSHLAAAKVFAQTLRMGAKAPLYSAWLGGYYAVTKNEGWAFLAEKRVTLLVLCSLVGLLALRLSNLPLSLLVCVWISNLKYFVIESNGTNVLASALMAAALLLVSYRRLTMALVLLLLAALTRPEIWLVLLLFSVCLVAKRQVSLRQCTIFAGVGLGIVALVHLRKTSETFVVTDIFFQCYAISYSIRHNLMNQSALAWNQVPQVLDHAMPAVAQRASFHDVFRAVWLYPKEYLSQIVFNSRSALHVVLAVLLGFDHRIISILSLAAAVPMALKTRVRIENPCLIELAVCSLLVIPITIFWSFPLWRYYLPLIPSAVVFAYLALSKVERYRQPTEEVPLTNRS